MAEKKVVRYKLVRHKWPDEIKAERNRKMKRAAIVVACIVCFFGGFATNGLFQRENLTNDATFQKLSSIYSVMSSEFYFGKDQKDFKEKLINGAIEGMVSAGEDKHTLYMEPQLSEEFTTSMEGSYVGIGVEFYEQSKDTFIIARVYEDSPAAKAGMQKGDKIYKINDTVCKNMDADEVKSLISGKENSKVNIEVIRENKHIKITTERSTVNNSVYTEIKGNIGVMEINSFSETTGNDVGKQLAEIKKAGCKGLVIDLRENGGGYLTAVQQTASYLMKKDQVIFKEKDTDGKTTEFKTIEDYKRYTFDEIVILINENTASASEVLTAALKEQLQNVSVVGEKSYGKGTVQIPQPFKDGSMLKYTIGEWITPKGNKINGVGITPDVKVSLDAAYSMGAPKLEDEVYKADSVSVAATSVQTYLKFLGYAVDRSDAYFSIQSSNALKQYQKDKGLKVTGAIDKDVITSLLSSVSLKWKANESNYDLQMKKAVQLANGK